MGTIKQSYTAEFKQEAVRLVTQGDVTMAQAARDLGLSYSVLARWKRESLTKGDQAFPGKGRPENPELDRLRREVEVLRQERDILKKAVGIFSPRLR